MNAIERKQEILKLLANRGKIEVDELTELFDVSKVTVRSDLDALKDKGLLIRTHGGAISPENHKLARLFSNTLVEQTTEKENIARKASELIVDGSTIILGNGSTTYHMVKYLSNKGLTVVTGNLLAVNELVRDESIDLIILGGMVRKYSLGTYGSLTNADAELINANWYFMGASALSPEGIWSSNLIQADTERRIMKSAKKVCVLSDSTKNEMSAIGKVCSWEGIDCFITDSITDEMKTVLERNGVEVIIA